MFKTTVHKSKKFFVLFCEEFRAFLTFKRKYSAFNGFHGMHVSTRPGGQDYLESTNDATMDCCWMLSVLIFR